ncbi:MAG: hypothetical protein QOG21_598 [Actinomycetota bacterium]|nr:hypothetical protein [Actinomycetota bacterium]
MFGIIEHCSGTLRQPLEACQALSPRPGASTRIQLEVLTEAKSNGMAKTAADRGRMGLVARLLLRGD